MAFLFLHLPTRIARSLCRAVSKPQAAVYVLVGVAVLFPIPPGTETGRYKKLLCQTIRFPSATDFIRGFFVRTDGDKLVSINRTWTGLYGVGGAACSGSGTSHEGVPESKFGNEDNSHP